ncbi:MAG TPA: hypothetical protein VEH82_05720 [Acidimicrobiales bacterium]|nr:hypothetical protein [Acidimicrobiales bacterium]
MSLILRTVVVRRRGWSITATVLALVVGLGAVIASSPSPVAAAPLSV